MSTLDVQQGHFLIDADQFRKLLGQGRRHPAMGSVLQVAAATEEEEELGDH